jgi:hypothetical protein
MKRCTKCGDSPKRTKEFWSVDKREPDGLGAQCRKCSQARDSERWRPVAEGCSYQRSPGVKGKKICSFCGAPKQLTQFHRHGGKLHPDGRDSRCKECTHVRLGAGRYQPLGRQMPHHAFAKQLRALVGHRVMTDKLRIGTGIGFRGQKPPDFN